MNNPWKYKGQDILDIKQLPGHENVIGFVYLIQDRVTLKTYIGKKVLYNTRKKKISKRAKKETGTRKIFEYVITESDWKTYYGSSKELQADIKKYGEQRFERTIMELSCTKKYLSYCEFSWQVKLDVLRSDNYNGNILGRYYARDMENCFKHE
jgi:hypothetical protein